MNIDNEQLWENLTISNDFIFSKVMRDKEICRETLEVLLDKRIGEINYIDDQKTIDLSYDSKSIRLDIYVEDEDRIYNVEMQVVNKKYLPKRSRYYQSIIDLNAIEKGQLYKELKDSIVIFICRFYPFGRGMSRYTFENICVEDMKIYLEDGTSKVFLNAKDYDKEKREDLKLFLEYVESNVVRENDFVRKVANKVSKIKENKEMRIEYMAWLMREREIAQESFEEGKAKGLEEGIVKGKAEGIEEGIARGKIEGIKEGIKNLCESLRGLGIEERIIKNELMSKYELSEEEVRKYLAIKA